MAKLWRKLKWLVFFLGHGVVRHLAELDILFKNGRASSISTAVILRSTNVLEIGTGGSRRIGRQMLRVYSPGSGTLLRDITPWSPP